MALEGEKAVPAVTVTRAGEGERALLEGLLPVLSLRFLGVRRGG
jgi:hypothetical protein